MTEPPDLHERIRALEIMVESATKRLFRIEALIVGALLSVFGFMASELAGQISVGIIP